MKIQPEDNEPLKTRHIIPMEDDETVPRTKLRQHNYYNERNAIQFLEMIKKWGELMHQDCYLAPAAFNMSKNSLRLKLTCARMFIVDNMSKILDDVTLSLVERCSFRMAESAIILRLKVDSTNTTFSNALQPTTLLPANPCDQFTKWLKTNPQPRQMFILKGLKLTEADMTWFKQILAQLKTDYEGEVNEQQVVVIKMASV